MQNKEHIDESIFSIDKMDSFVGKNSWKIGLSLVFIIILASYIGRESINIGGMFGVIVFFLALFYIFERSFQKYIETIHFDFEKSALEVHLLRRNHSKLIPFNNIISIKVNGLVIIKTIEQTLYYKDISNDNLFYNLNKIKEIEWGYLSKVFGPSKITRNKLKIKE
ncbi:hypothetical protein [Desulforhopalus sp. 52FAK]